MKIVIGILSSLIFNFAAYGATQDNFGVIILEGTKSQSSWDWKWMVDLDALQGEPYFPDAKVIYDGLNIQPNCGSQFCTKGFGLSTGESFSSNRRLDVDFYGLTINQTIKNSMVQIPLSVTVANSGDQNLLKKVLGGNQDISTVQDRFQLSCTQTSCSYTLRSLSLYQTYKKQIGVDPLNNPIYEETFRKGDPYSLGTVFSDSTVTINGDEADKLATAIGLPPSSQYAALDVTLSNGNSAYASFGCVRSPDDTPTNRCVFTVQPVPDEGPAFVFPEKLTFKYDIELSKQHFPKGFNFNSLDGMIGITCNESQVTQTCTFQLDPLGGDS